MRWIGRGESEVSAKIRLNPIGIFFWGCMKSLVCENPKGELLGRVMVASNHIQQDSHILQRIHDYMSRKINFNSIYVT